MLCGNFIPMLIPIFVKSLNWKISQNIGSIYGNQNRKISVIIGKYCQHLWKLENIGKYWHNLWKLKLVNIGSICANLHRKISVNIGKYW